jgi:hypothetical protein
MSKYTGLINALSKKAANHLAGRLDNNVLNFSFHIANEEFVIYFDGKFYHIDNHTTNDNNAFKTVKELVSFVESL